MSNKFPGSPPIPRDLTRDMELFLRWVQETLEIGTTNRGGEGSTFITKDVLVNTLENLSTEQPIGYVTKSSTFYTTGYETTIECRTNSFTVYLITAVGRPGKIYNIKNVGPGTITVDAHGTETIDGSLTKTVATNANLCIQSNGTNWIIL